MGLIRLRLFVLAASLILVDRFSYAERISSVPQVNPIYDEQPPDAKCERLPQPNISDSIHVDGILFLNYEDTAYIDQRRFWLPVIAAHDDYIGDARFDYMGNNFGFQEAAGLLLKTKLKYIEIEAPPQQLKEKFKRFAQELGFTNDANYLRLSISTIGDPECGAYESFRNYFAGIGLNDNQCIASHSSQSPQSEYAVYFENQPIKNWYGKRYVGPDLWQIKEVRSGKVRAQILTKLVYKYPCPTKDVRDQFWNVIRANP